MWKRLAGDGKDCTYLDIRETSLITEGFKCLSVRLIVLLASFTERHRAAVLLASRAKSNVGCETTAGYRIVH
jgi:hypothetical protein